MSIEATGFEPGVALYLVPYPASATSTQAILHHATCHFAIPFPCRAAWLRAPGYLNLVQPQQVAPASGSRNPRLGPEARASVEDNEARRDPRALGPADLSPCGSMRLGSGNEAVRPPRQGAEARGSRASSKMTVFRQRRLYLDSTEKDAPEKCKRNVRFWQIISRLIQPVPRQVPGVGLGSSRIKVVMRKPFARGARGWPRLSSFTGSTTSS